MGILTPGFSGRGRGNAPDLPPGQYLTRDFPVLSAGPTPRLDLDDWRFAEMAGPMGGDGVRVSSRAELAAALEAAATTRGRFQLVEAMIPRGVLSATLRRFVAGVKRLSAPGEAS